MNTKYTTIFLFALLTYQLGYGQINLLDSCGIDSNSELNRYEIRVIYSLLFAPRYSKKSGTIDPKNGFDFTGKRMAFFSCTKDKNTNGNGFLSKSEFFEFFKPAFKGHAGNGLIVFNEIEKKESNGFDAVIIIDCPYPYVTTKELVSKLALK
ncbi:MAG: hypothetical protein QY309_18400 [Cyclobacteriaceae bacterium]|nr:MAG: hypothetical protein QY309_18400 [Cyclobacteriaceae bacterium]